MCPLIFVFIHVTLHNFYLVLYVRLVKQFEFCIVLINLHSNEMLKLVSSGICIIYHTISNLTISHRNLFHVFFSILLSTFNCHMQKFSACVLPGDTNTYLNSKDHIMLNKRLIF